MAKRKPRRVKPPKKFFSMREVILTGTQGHTVIMPANKPTLVPEVLWLEATRKGCIEFDADLIRAAAAAAAAAVEEEESAPSSGDSNPRDRVKSAVSQVLMLNDPSALTKEGVPKVAVVKRLVDDPSVEIRTELVYDLYLELQSVFDDENEDDETLEEVEKRVDRSGLEDADGIDEEVGGGVAAALAAAGGDAGGLEDDEE